MTKKLQCPFTKSPCIRRECALWVSDAIRVTNLKTHKSGIKDTSGCAITKLGEDAAMRMWNTAEDIINGGNDEE